MPRRLKNIRRWKGKWQVYTEIHGKTHSQGFPLGTPTATMRQWITDERAKFATTKAVRGSFGADIDDYLSRVTALDGYVERKRDLYRWADRLGRDRPRHSITATEIDRELQRWLLAGLAPATVKKRRMALNAMWNKLDGRDQHNPVRGTQSPQEPKPEARALDYALIRKLLDAMTPPPLVGRRKSRRAFANRQRAQLIARVIAWTGLPPKVLMHVTRADVNFDAATVRVKPRRKGKGVEARTVPLLPQAIEAFRAFDAGEAYGPFNTTSINYYFRSAGLRLEPPVTTYTLYDLRHSFLTMLYRVTKDLATVARFALHAHVSMSQRYAMGANVDVDRQAAQHLGQTLSSQPDHSL